MAEKKNLSKEEKNKGNTLYSILSKIGNIRSAEQAATIFGRIMVMLDIAGDENNENVEYYEVFNNSVSGPYVFQETNNQDLKRKYKLSTESSNKQMRNFINRKINDYGAKDKDSNNNIRRIIAEELACKINTNAIGKTIYEIEKIKTVFKKNNIDEKIISEIITAFKSEEYDFIEEFKEYRQDELRQKRNELRQYVLSLKAIKNYILSFDDLYTKLAWIFLVSCFPPMPEDTKKDYLIEIIYPALGLEAVYIDKEEKVELLNPHVLELKHDAENISQNDNSEYAKFINETKLPSKLDKTENIFSFRSNKIEFQGRNDELKKLNKWLIQGHVSVWAVTGHTGSGKRRLALHFATKIEDNTKKESMGKAVWVDNEILDKLLKFNDFSYPKPVLFICDYAALYEEKLSDVVDKMSRMHTNAKFLLIDRSDLWYSDYLRKNGVVNEYAVKEPINLDYIYFSSKRKYANGYVNEYAKIMQDLSDALYGENVKTISNDAQYQIIQKAKELSGEKKSVRCLFLLLVTDAYLKDPDIRHLNAQNLLENYLEPSRNKLSKDLKNRTIDVGYRILAYVTACGGISFSDIKNHKAIQDEWETIKGELIKRSKINQFFQQMSEIYELDTVSAMKPDLIGELLFLHEWNELIDEQNDWLFDLLKQDYSRSFFAMCLTDWKEESIALCDMLSNQNAEAEQHFACAVVFNLAVHEAHSEEERKKYVAKIKALDQNFSPLILKEYTDAIRFIFEHTTNSIRAECTTLLNEVKWEQYLRDCLEDQMLFADACCDTASIYDDLGYFDSAIGYYCIAMDIHEKVLGVEHQTTAATYNNIALVYRAMGNFEKALKYIQKALSIRKIVLGVKHPTTAATYNNTAFIYKAIGDFKSALNCCNEALAICEETLGAEHPTTAATYNNFAVIYNAKGDSFDEALKYANKALNIREKVFGTEHLYTSATYNVLSIIYRGLSNLDEALKYANKAKNIREKVLGSDHPSTAVTYNNLALIYKDLGDLDKETRYVTKAENIREKVSVSNHPSTAVTYNNLANIYSAMGNNTKALEYSRKANGVIDADN